MSTRSFIGKLNADGTVRAIYHHWDGYVEGVGDMLIKHYMDESKIDKLLDLGDMSLIGTEPVGYWCDYTEPIRKDMCMTYRERGETGTDAITYASADNYLDKCAEDFTYLFKNGDWYYRKWEDRNLKLVRDYFK